MAAMGIVPQRLGNEFGFAVPSNSYRCKDGWVYVAVLLDSHWKALAPILGHPRTGRRSELFRVANRLANRDACNAMVAAWAAERTRAEAIEVLLKAGLAASPVNHTTRPPRTHTSLNAMFCSWPKSKTAQLRFILDRSRSSPARQHACEAALLRSASTMTRFSTRSESTRRLERASRKLE